MKNKFSTESDVSSVMIQMAEDMTEPMVVTEVMASPLWGEEVPLLLAGEEGGVAGASALAHHLGEGNELKLFKISFK